MSVAAGLTATKAGLDVAKLLMDKLHGPDVDVHDVRAKVQEMLIHVVNAQVALGEAQVEISELRHQVDERNRIENFGNAFVFEEGMYWYRDYPYCPNCWDSDRKPIRLDSPYATNTSNTAWNCSQHKSKYYLKRRPQWQ